MSLCPAGQVRQEVAQGSGGQVRQEVAQASVVGAASDVAGHTGQVRQEVAQGSGGQVRQEVAQASVVGAASDVAGHSRSGPTGGCAGILEVRSDRRLRRLLW